MTGSFKESGCSENTISELITSKGERRAVAIIRRVGVLENEPFKSIHKRYQKQDIC